MSFELGARQACDRRHRTMGTVHSGKISHLTWTFTKKYWAVLGCTGLYWAVLGHLRYLLGNVQVNIGGFPKRAHPARARYLNVNLARRNRDLQPGGKEIEGGGRGGGGGGGGGGKGGEK